MQDDTDKDLQRRVNMAVDQAFNDRLPAAINKVLDQRRSLDEATHRAHHDYIHHLIESDRRRQQLRDKVMQQVAGWAVVVFLTGVGYVLYAWANGFVQNLIDQSRHLK